MDRRTGFEVDMLVQQTQLQTSRANQVATIRSLIASDEPENRALTGAVSTYKSNVFSSVHLQGCASQHILNSIRLVYF